MCKFEWSIKIKIVIFCDFGAKIQMSDLASFSQNRILGQKFARLSDTLGYWYSKSELKKVAFGQRDFVVPAHAVRDFSTSASISSLGFLSFKKIQMGIGRISNCLSR